MQKINLFSLTLIAFLTAISAQATNFAVVVGGNGESQHDRHGSDNMFIGRVNGLVNDLKKIGWQTKTLFDSDPKKIQAGASVSSKAALFAQLDQIIKTGKAGDQALLWISVHGGPGCFMINETDCMPYKDPALAKRLAKLKQMQVKLGFANEACFSGSQIKEFSKYGCAISSQGPESTSFADPLSNTLHDALYSKRDVDLKQNSKFSMNDLFLLDLAAKNTSKHYFTTPNVSGFDYGNKIGNRLGVFDDSYITYNASGTQIMNTQVTNRCETLWATMNANFGPLVSAYQDEQLQKLGLPSDQDALKNIGIYINRMREVSNAYQKVEKEKEPILTELVEADPQSIKVPIGNWKIKTGTNVTENPTPQALSDFSNDLNDVIEAAPYTGTASFSLGRKNKWRDTDGFIVDMKFPFDQIDKIAAKSPNERNVLVQTLLNEVAMKATKRGDTFAQDELKFIQSPGFAKMFTDSLNHEMDTYPARLTETNKLYKDIAPLNDKTTKLYRQVDQLYKDGQVAHNGMNQLLAKQFLATKRGLDPCVVDPCEDFSLFERPAKASECAPPECKP